MTKQRHTLVLAAIFSFAVGILAGWFYCASQCQTGVADRGVIISSNCGLTGTCVVYGARCTVAIWPPSHGWQVMMRKDGCYDDQVSDAMRIYRGATP